MADVMFTFSISLSALLDALGGDFGRQSATTGTMSTAATAGKPTEDDDA